MISSVIFYPNWAYPYIQKGAFLYLKWAFPKVLKGVVPKIFPGASPPDPTIPCPHFMAAGSATLSTESSYVVPFH